MVTLNIPEIPGIPGNPIYIVLGVIAFYYIIGEPMLQLNFIKSLLLFIVLYVLYMKFGKQHFGSAFGKNR